MPTSVIERILGACDIRYRGILPPQKGYRNTSYPIETASGDMLNLVLYKQEVGMLARIRRADVVSDYLVARGFPARKRQGRIMQLSASRRVRYAALYNYLPGTTIPWEAYTQQHIKSLGQLMGGMHAALRRFEPQGNVTAISIISHYEDLLFAMSAYFNDEGVRRALDTKLGLQLGTSAITRVNDCLKLCHTITDRQQLHMDLVRGNILFEDESSPIISGILDFEKTAYGPPVFDVARTLAFLLVDCKYKQPEKVRKYFLYSGYMKRGQASLGKQQTAVLDGLVRLNLLHDFYKFLKHNPYEYLPQNEHFVRTRDFLLKDGIIKRINGSNAGD